MIRNDPTRRPPQSVTRLRLNLRVVLIGYVVVFVAGFAVRGWFGW